MKNLYLLISSNGDGSSSVRATFSEEVVDYVQNNEDIFCERFFDGDGFNCQMWTVPDECTAKNMGFNELTMEDITSYY